MAMNYKEAPQGAPKSELRRYAKGIKLMDGLADSLAAEGLLPPRFKTLRATTLRGTEATLVLPEGAIRLPEIQTVGMSNKEMENAADSTRGLNIGTWARQGLQRAATSSGGEQTLSPVAMSAHTMGLRAEYPTTTQVWKKAKEFGNTISAEAMLKLAIEAAKGNIQVEVGKPLVGIMEPFTDSSGSPNVLYVVRHEDGLFLIASYARADHEWRPGYRFVVSPRK